MSSRLSKVRKKKFSFFVLNKQLLVLHSIYCLLLILKKSIKEGVFFPLYLSSALLNLGFLVLTAKNDPICDKLRLGVHHFNALARGALLDGNLWLFSLSLFCNAFSRQEVRRRGRLTYFKSTIFEIAWLLVYQENFKLYF